MVQGHIRFMINDSRFMIKRSGDGSLIRLTLNRREYCKSGNMTQEEKWFRLFSGWVVLKMLNI